MEVRMGGKNEQVSASQTKALAAAQALGRGFDVTLDLKLEYCKNSQARLIEFDDSQEYEIILPDNVVIPNLPKDIKCDQGDLTRYRSDVLDFHQMSERFNQGLSIAGKMPLGLFNSMFNFKGPWQVDASSTKNLALDGWFISLYHVRVARAPLVLRKEIKDAVPSTWQPAALARFIEKYGTHIVTGVKVGGKDVVYLRQMRSSTLSSGDVQRCLETFAEQRFASTSGKASKGKGPKGAKKKVADPLASLGPIERLKQVDNYSSASFTSKEDLEIILQRKGGSKFVRDHSEWLATVPFDPEVISMSFVPITSLLNGILGCGFLTHAINLYLRYRPPIEELRYFLEFQIPRQWSTGLYVGPERKDSSFPALQFSLMGPKLYVYTSEVTSEKRPTTGLRLYLEGKRSNRLAIHLQYLTTLPKMLEQHWFACNEAPVWKGPEEDPRWVEHVQWKSFSNVNTCPIEYLESHMDEDAAASIVTGAQLQVLDSRTRNILALKLQFSRVPGCSIRRSVWDHSPHTASQRYSLFSQLGFSSAHQSDASKPAARVIQNSAVFSGGPTAPSYGSKLLRFVDVSEMSKGVQDQPGHWVVTGARLEVEGNKILVRVKYSLLRY